MAFHKCTFMTVILISFAFIFPDITAGNPEEETNTASSSAMKESTSDTIETITPEPATSPSQETNTASSSTMKESTSDTIETITPEPATSPSQVYDACIANLIDYCGVEKPDILSCTKQAILKYREDVQLPNIPQPIVEYLSTLYKVTSILDSNVPKKFCEERGDKDHSYAEYFNSEDTVDTCLNDLSDMQNIYTTGGYSGFHQMYIFIFLHRNLDSYPDNKIARGYLNYISNTVQVRGKNKPSLPRMNIYKHETPQDACSKYAGLQ